MWRFFFFLLDCALRREIFESLLSYALSISLCGRLSHHPGGSNSHTVHAQFPLPLFLFFSPLQLHSNFVFFFALIFFFHYLCLLQSLKVGILAFLAPVLSTCHSWDACLSFSPLPLTISLDSWMFFKLAACLFSLYVSGCVCHSSCPLVFSVFLSALLYLGAIVL